MPAPGEQHTSAAAFNPFEEAKPRLSEYTAQEIATLQSRLEKQLGPEYISARPGAGGGKVYYVSGEKCINLANEVFGFNGWSSTIREIQVDFADEISAGKYNVGLSVIFRVILRDGTFHEDIGYGHIENCKGKAAAFEKAKKEATTDALKRALRNFGKVLGLCVYDKDYLAKVTKMKVEPSKWDPVNLHRHSDYDPAKIPPRREPEAVKVVRETSQSTAAECDDEFGTAEFDEADFGVMDGDHPDEVVLEAFNAASVTRPSSPIKPQQGLPRQKIPELNQQGQQGPRLQSNGKAHHMNGNPFNGGQNPALSRNDTPGQPNMASGQPANAMASRQQQGHAQNSNLGQQRQPGAVQHQAQQANRGRQAGNGAQNGPPQQHPANPSAGTRWQPQQNINQNGGNSHGPNPENLEAEPTVRFVTARAAENIQHGKVLVQETVAFNPHLDSPSIRKTAGVDHSLSKPVPREIINKGSVTPIPSINPKNNFVNPHLDQKRRVGMPVSATSPLQNRNSYKPPQMTKRAGEAQSLENARPALNDVTAASVNAPFDGGNEFKRVKMEPGQVTGAT